MQFPAIRARSPFAVLHRNARAASIAALLLASALSTLSASATLPKNPLQLGGQVQGSLEMLHQLASEQIAKDTEFLGKTRFKADLQNHTYFYDPRPAPVRFVLSEDDPYAVPLEALIRVETLRRDFRASVPNETFWIGPLAAVEETAIACVRGADASSWAQIPPDAEKACSGRIQPEFNQLSQTIAEFADAHNLQLAVSQGRDPAPGFHVEIKIDPPRARLRIMPLLEYKKYQYLKSTADQYRWNDMLDSSSELIGWYHYRLDWPAELKGPEEGDFCIKKPGTITFRPH